MADPHALFTDELLRRAVQQQIAQENAQPAPVQPPVEEKARIPKSGLLALLAGGAADVGTTIYGLQSGLAQEHNPLLRWGDPKLTIPLGAAAEAATYWLARKTLGQRHPKIFNALSLGLGALHGGLALKNLGTIADAKHDRQVSASGQPPRPNMVWHPSGYWYDPEVFGRE